MIEYHADLFWTLAPGEDFIANRYSRRHVLRFDGGAELAGSSSPHVVPLPWSDAAAVDPEELFVAALSSCHMLWFLSIAAKQGLSVERYADAAVGVMARDAQGKVAMTRVTLHPDVAFAAGHGPSRVELLALHEAAHAACFIASSVKTEVLCEPVIAA